MSDDLEMTGPCGNIKTVFPGKAETVMVMEVPILLRQHLYN